MTFPSSIGLLLSATVHTTGSPFDDTLGSPYEPMSSRSEGTMLSTFWPLIPILVGLDPPFWPFAVSCGDPIPPQGDRHG